MAVVLLIFWQSKIVLLLSSFLVAYESPVPSGENAKLDASLVKKLSQIPSYQCLTGGIYIFRALSEDRVKVNFTSLDEKLIIFGWKKPLLKLDKMNVNSMSIALLIFWQFRENAFLFSSKIVTYVYQIPS